MKKMIALGALSLITSAVASPEIFVYCFEGDQMVGVFEQDDEKSTCGHGVSKDSWLKQCKKKVGPADDVVLSATGKGCVSERT